MYVYELNIMYVYELNIIYVYELNIIYVSELKASYTEFLAHSRWVTSQPLLFGIVSSPHSITDRFSEFLYFILDVWARLHSCTCRGNVFLHLITVHLPFRSAEHELVHFSV